MGWLILAAAVGGTIAAAGVYVFTLRRVGGNLLGNPGFEDPRGDKFRGGNTSTMSLSNGSTEIENWVVTGTITWSRENNIQLRPKQGDLFLDVVNRSATGPTGGVSQGLRLDPDSDYEFSVHVGAFPFGIQTAGGHTSRIRVTIEDTAPITRFRREFTSFSGNALKWEKFTLRFDTRGWVVRRNQSGAIEQSGAIYIKAPRELASKLNTETQFIGLDEASLFLLESTFGRFFR